MWHCKTSGERVATVCLVAVLFVASERERELERESERESGRERNIMRDREKKRAMQWRM